MTSIASVPKSIHLYTALTEHLGQRMFETTFKNLDDTLRKDDGCSTEMDYIEQTSWVLFLKYLDDFEADREATAKLSGQLYKRILEDEYAWHVWAAPKRADGKLDYNSGLTGDDLKEFVDNKLFPYLRNFKVNAERADSIEYKIGEIFSELKNKLVSGYSLREVINKVDELRFRSNEEKHEMSSLYEDKIKSMGNAGRNGGEYYTPRPLIKTIVKVVNPQIGNRVYDGAVGSAGFLCEAYDYMRNSKQLTATEYEQLQKKTFYGKEKKSLAYIIGVMNMILHGIEAPNIQHGNTLAENISDIQDKDRVDVILANPPFGSSTEHFEVQQNFPIKSGETAYMFLQHFIKMLKRGGRCGVVIKNTFLSNPDNASVALRKQLLEECEITAILDLPKGVFTGTGVSTVVLFFTKGKPTTKVWYYQLNLARNLGKTNSLNEQDLADFIRLSASQGVSDNSWFIDIKDIDKTTWDLTVTNPNHIDVTDVRTPELILEEIEQLDAESTTTNFEIKRLLNEFYERGSERWEVRTIEQMIEKTKNVSPDKNPDTEFTYVDVSSISNTSFSIVSTQKLLGKDAPSRAKKNILKNDILYATVRPTLKRIAIVPEHLDNQVASTGYVVLRANKNNYFKFLFYFLFTKKFFRAMETLQRGASYPAVTDGDVKSQTLLAPKFEEQKLVSEKIEEIISNIDLKIDSELKKIDELKALKQSILQQAFSGELVKD